MNAFKYRNFEKGLKILTDLELPLSSPDSFNDPFEFSPTLTASSFTREKAIRTLNDEALFEDWFNRARNRTGPQIIRYGHKQWWRDWYFKNLDKIVDELSHVLPDGVEWLRKNFAKESAKFWLIGCFSYTPDEVLMWAHYSDDNKGVVIEFDLDKPPFNDSKILRILPVEYSDELIPYDFPQSNADFETTLHAITRRKHTRWSYEQEVRILVTKDAARDGRYLVLDASSIVSVTFGHKCPEAFKTSVKKTLVSSHFSHVVVYEAKLNHQERIIYREAIAS